MRRRLMLCLALLCFAAPAVVVAAPVDDARLLAAGEDAGNWLTFGRDYTNQHFSPLAQINSGTVAQLAPRWIYQTGIVGSFQTEPLVADGVMYLSIPGNHVVALNAINGEPRWRYDHVSRLEHPRGGKSNRGVALAYGNVYQATNDGRLIALDAGDGHVVWDVVLSKPTADDLAYAESLGPEAVATMTSEIDQLPSKMPPLVYDGKVIVGVIGAGYGAYSDIAARLGLENSRPLGESHLGQRGFIAAFDATDGSEIWRWHTIAAEGWEGEFSATTPSGEILPRDVDAERQLAPDFGQAWRAGGSSTWMTPALDAELGLIYVGTGNAAPSDLPQARPGDNLYANSLVALDVATGELRWYHQQVPHDIWGYDVASQPILFEVPNYGGRVPAVGVAGKTGWFYVHNRADGRLMYRSEPFVPQKNLFAGPTPEGTVFAPGSFGGASWSPTAYHPGHGLIYVAGVHRPSVLTSETFEDPNTGEAIEVLVTELAGEAEWGTLTAIDIWSSGRIHWQVRTPQPLVGGVLATAGDLVFTGEGSGRFNAFDAETGARVWSFRCGAGVNAPPITYSVRGTQYVAVAAGGSTVYGTPLGDTVIAFALVGQ